MTGKERFSCILRHEQVDRVGLFEVYWRETARKWSAEGHFGKPEDISDHFGLDVRRTGGEITPGDYRTVNLVADVDAADMVVEETGAWKLVRDGNGALLRWNKRASGAPEHVGFFVEDRHGWEEHIRPHLRDLGYRYVVVTPSYYIAVRTPSEHLRLFGAAKDAADGMELVAYNIPGCTASTIAVDTFCEMAKRGWIRCCKESSGDFPYLRELIRRGADIGLSVLAGHEATSGRALLAGARGIVPVCANYDPATYLRLYHAGHAGDKAGVARQMKRAMQLKDALVMSAPCWLAGIKYAVSVLGLGSGLPVSPLEPADDARAQRIAALIESDGQAGVLGKDRA